MSKEFPSSGLSKEFEGKLKEIAGVHSPAFCYQCVACTSACPIAKLDDSYRPHKIVIDTLLGFISQLLESETIWKCASCLTCTTRCPQLVAPADLILALRTLACETGQPIPKGYMTATGNVHRLGSISSQNEVMDREGEFVERGDLGLVPQLISAEERKIIGSVLKVILAAVRERAK